MGLNKDIEIKSTELITNNKSLNEYIDFFLDGTTYTKDDMLVIKEYAKRKNDYTETIRIRGINAKTAKKQRNICLDESNSVPYIDILKMPKVGTVFVRYGTPKEWHGGIILPTKSFELNVVPYIDLATGIQIEEDGFVTAPVALVSQRGKESLRVLEPLTGFIDHLVKTGSIVDLGNQKVTEPYGGEYTIVLSGISGTKDIFILDTMTYDDARCLFLGKDGYLVTPFGTISQPVSRLDKNDVIKTIQKVFDIKMDKNKKTIDYNILAEKVMNMNRGLMDM